MKKIIVLILAVFLIAPFTGNSQDLTLKKILKKHYKVMKFKEFSNVSSMLVNGEVMAQGMEMPFVQKVKRPGKLRTEVTFQGMQMVQAVSGDVGWMIIPWTGSNDPQDMPAEQLSQFKEQAEFEGELYNWEDKVANVELEGKEDMDGTEVYKIKVTKNKVEGEDEAQIRFYYLDTEKFVILKVYSKRMINETETEVEAIMSNYKEINGYLTAQTIEQKMGGVTVTNINIKSVEYNVDIDDSEFERPTKE